VLFVGTKRSAQDIIAEQSVRGGMFFVNNRWLGGTLTNWKTVKESIKRLVELEKARDDGRFELLTKKEALELNRKIEKMDRSLGGIKTMNGLPSIMFVIDPKREHIAVREANKLKIPVVALCDTNCDPSGIDHVIPGNDDALKSIRLFTSALSDACIEGRQMGRGAHGGVVVSDEEAKNIEVVRRGTDSVE
jgi:small subunit ribosomal protein S2